MSTIAFPTPARVEAQNRRWLLWALAGFIALAAMAAYWMTTRTAASSQLALTGKFYIVSPADLDVKVKKDGELQSVNSIEIVSMVEGLNTLTQIVKEGSYVKKGDILI